MEGDIREGTIPIISVKGIVVDGVRYGAIKVEIEVEKELGIKSKKEVEELGIEKFVNLCKERVTKYSDVQTDQSKRLGYWMDWENSYYTMSDENNYAIWAFLKKLFNEEKIYRGTDVVPWSGRSGTSYSQMEIIEGRKLTVHKGVFVKLSLKDKKNENILIWTTTPWTLPGNVGLAVGPEVTYVRVKITADAENLKKIKENNKASDFKKFFSKEDLQKEYGIYLNSLNKSFNSIASA